MKRIIFTFLLLLVTVVTFAVDNLFQAGGVDNNWSTVGNWSQGTVPTSTDGYVTRFDATSPNCTVIGTIFANHINFTGYTGTITMTASDMYVYGNITLSATMTTVGAGRYLNAVMNGTLTSNGQNMVWGLSIYQTNHINIFADDWTVPVLRINGGGTCTMNGSNIYVTGNLLQTTAAICTGTTNIIMNGTGSWSNSSTGQLRNNITINTAGTITISGTVYYNTGTLTYTAGTIVNTGSTLNVGTCTLDLNDITLNNFNVNVASAVVTLASGFKIAGQLTSSVTGSSIVSSVGGTLRKITLLAGMTTPINATNNIDATDIDSRDGYPVQSIGAVLSNTFNWYARALSSDFLIMFE